MLEDGREHLCKTQNVSATGIAVRGFPPGGIGEWVVANLNELGRVEGIIVRGEDGWFAFEMAAMPSKLQKLALKVASLVD
jgi:hypothetical protein